MIEVFASNQLKEKCWLLLTLQPFLLKYPLSPSSLGCNKKVLVVKGLRAHLNTLSLFRKAGVDGKEQMDPWDQIKEQEAQNLIIFPIMKPF